MYYSLQQRLMRKEQKEGGKLISSVDSLDFSVALEEDVEITIKDVEGWTLDEASPKVLYMLLVF